MYLRTKHMKYKQVKFFSFYPGKSMNFLCVLFISAFLPAFCLGCCSKQTNGRKKGEDRPQEKYHGERTAMSCAIPAPSALQPIGFKLSTSQDDDLIRICILCEDNKDADCKSVGKHGSQFYRNFTWPMEARLLPGLKIQIYRYIYAQ